MQRWELWVPFDADVAVAVVDAADAAGAHATTKLATVVAERRAAEAQQLRHR